MDQSSREGLLRAADLSDDSDFEIDATDYLDKHNPHADERARAVDVAREKAQTFRRRCLRRPLRSKCCIVTLSIFGVLLLFLVGGGAFSFHKLKQEPPYGQSPPWYPSPRGGTAKSWAESYEKAARLVERMTLPEKVNVTTGTGWMMGLAVGTNGPASIVGFPQLNLQDGPLGIRFADRATAFPAGITVGATWNKELMYARGKAHGAEAKAKGVNVLLGPCVGPLGRMPAGGRNWEGFGADPYLQGVAGSQTVLGIQSEGIMATIKHFVGNEQEHFRQPWEWLLPNAISSNIDDRTLHELYAWPFGDAVKAGVASVMCSYNMVNNSYACGNSKLLNGILKDELGFQGFVMSDWLAQRGGVSTALAGLDMTMPGDGLRWANGESLWGPELTRSVLNGTVPMERLDDMVTRIVASWYKLGQDDEKVFDRKGPNFSSWTDDKMAVLAPGSSSPQDVVEVNRFVNVQGNHSDIARKVATEGIVLLKNDRKTLPLSPEALGAAYGGKVKIGIFGEDAGPGQGPNACKDRGCNQGTLGSGWGSGSVEFPYLKPPAEALRERLGDKAVELTEHLVNTPPMKKDPALLLSQDICIVFANSDSGEGFIKATGVAGDRNDLYLQAGGEELVLEVAAQCGGGKGITIVVIHAVGPVLMERWIDLPTVKAVVWANLPGQESGNALADVLFGTVNPSGKLPYTIGRTLDDYGPGAKVMYLPNDVIPQQDFKEGVFVDYRHFDKQKIKPRFEFGFGLSYTTFALSNMTVHGVKPKSPLPSPRPEPAAQPPKYDSRIPEKSEVLFPQGLRRLSKYIYPYLEPDTDVSKGSYPYPDGYDTKQPLSPAGGEEGGNPDLWDTYVTVEVAVSNTGSLAGKCVAQLYMSYPAALETPDLALPVRVLRGFEKVELQPNETKTITFKVTRRDLSYWDVKEQNWRMGTDGKYTFSIGQSSRDLPLEGSW